MNKRERFKCMQDEFIANPSYSNVYSKTKEPESRDVIGGQPLNGGQPRIKLENVNTKLSQHRM